MLSYYSVSVHDARDPASGASDCTADAPQSGQAFTSDTLTVNVWLTYFPLKTPKVIHDRHERPELE